MSERHDDRGSSAVSMVTLLASLVATAVVAGLIGAGLVMPAVGAVGATARGGVGFFDALPAELEQSPLSQQSRILYADGSTLATFYSENRIIVPLNKVAPIMRKAQVAIEDTRFYTHGGVDPRGLARAVVSNASGDQQGASTLTQQYVKAHAAGERDLRGRRGGRAGRRPQGLLPQGSRRRSTPSPWRRSSARTRSSRAT
ncbi:hypothetical protein GCM10025868_17810 [Angustibacter aerolatus]|uniref:Glycosyl transferase family 51 domain-containing protein n=1 Tax=Angustibacter aerolatus TaxID=1162965 RepID=A0ABQ6JEA2_9ACTN|nr:biosynthetic peptidoglycan transglycosylase [Angustibacter aerolatus]GMA86531.1 hypothetical protein GCM10025868_17810 [Angustibacter aerolatus]